MLNSQILKLNKQLKANLLFHIFGTENVLMHFLMPAELEGIPKIVKAQIPVQSHIYKVKNQSKRSTATYLFAKTQ